MPNRPLSGDPNVNPYESPTCAQDAAGRQPDVAPLDRVGRMVILASLVYMALYIPYFLVQGYRLSHGIAVSPLAIFPAHFLGMALNFAALVFTIRDLYLRPFPDPNAKLTWSLLILTTGGIGWIVYVFKYALKPRAAPGGTERATQAG